MKITEDVRRYAAEQQLAEEEAIAAGLAEKSEQFRRGGSEVYR
jgi:phosphomethylpyrimidine synthase